MNGESDNFEFYSFPQNEDVIYNWASNIEFGAGLMGVGNTSFTAINSSTIPIIANLTVTATVTTNGVTCASPPKTFTITVNPAAGSSYRPGRQQLMIILPTATRLGRWITPKW